MQFLERLANQLNLSESALKEQLEGASRKYKAFKIQKRSGLGYRLIAQPNKDIKAAQKAFLDIVSLPSHPCVLSYRQGLSIRDNARAHQYHRFLLKLDFSDFFHCLTPRVFWNELSRLEQTELTKTLIQEQELINELLFWRPGPKSKKLILSIGAPSSPALSNFCLYSFDEQVSDFCQKFGITYTRYADDLTFSTNQPGVLFPFYQVLKTQILPQFRFLRLNLGKTVFASKRTNRHVTGIVISSTGDLSLGRTKKRFIRGLVHRLLEGSLEGDDLSYLKGYLSFARYIEPDFIKRLQQKYPACPLLLNEEPAYAEYPHDDTESR